MPCSLFYVTLRTDFSNCDGRKCLLAHLSVWINSLVLAQYRHLVGLTQVNPVGFYIFKYHNKTFSRLTFYGSM